MRRSRQKACGVAATGGSARCSRLGALILTGALAAGYLAAGAFLPASSLAAGSAPIALDSPKNGNPPLIAYDTSTQTTYVAWTDPGNTGVDLCVLAASATSCSGGAPVLLQDATFTGTNAPVLGGLVVLPGGTAVVIGAPVSGGSIAWASPAGGAAFAAAGHGLQNAGNLISPVSLFDAFGNAVALGSADIGLLDDQNRYFSDSPLTVESPAISAPNSNPGGQYPGKALFTNGPEIAAEAAPAPAPAGTEIVVGVGANGSSAELTPSGCSNYAATGFGVSAGLVSGTSHAAGTLNGAGLPAYGLLACSANTPVLASGGQDGIGVLEQEGSGVSGAGSAYTLDYRPFSATATGGTFGAPVQLSDVTGQTLNGIAGLDVVDDSGTGVYATWLQQKPGALVFDYSSTGGATWAGPSIVPAPAAGTQDNPVTAGLGGGNAEIAYDSNPGSGTQVFVQPITVPPVSTPPAADSVTTTQASGTTTGASITIPAGTVGETDSATITGANASTATGTVTYSLYSDSSCATGVLSDTGTVASGVAAPAAVATVLAPGTYYWKAAYGGDARNAASASACGSEILTVVPAASAGGTGTSTSTTVTVTVVCSGPCTVTVTVTVGSPSPAADAGAARASKKITLASGTFKLATAGSKRLTLRLTKTGKRYVRAHHGRLKATLLVSQTIDGHRELTTRTVKIAPLKR